MSAEGVKDMQCIPKSLRQKDRATIYTYDGVCLFAYWFQRIERNQFFYSSLK